MLSRRSAAARSYALYMAPAARVACPKSTEVTVEIGPSTHANLVAANGKTAATASRQSTMMVFMGDSLTMPYGRVGHADKLHHNHRASMAIAASYWLPRRSARQAPAWSEPCGRSGRHRSRCAGWWAFFNQILEDDDVCDRVKPSGQQRHSLQLLCQMCDRAARPPPCWHPETLKLARALPRADRQKSCRRSPSFQRAGRHRSLRRPPGK